jgi:hypothetical protein
MAGQVDEQREKEVKGLRRVFAALVNFRIMSVVRRA